MLLCTCHRQMMWNGDWQLLRATLPGFHLTSRFCSTSALKTVLRLIMPAKRAAPSAPAAPNKRVAGKQPAAVADAQPPLPPILESLRKHIEEDGRVKDFLDEISGPVAMGGIEEYSAEACKSAMKARATRVSFRFHQLFRGAPATRVFTHPSSNWRSVKTHIGRCRTTCGLTLKAPVCVSHVQLVNSVQIDVYYCVLPLLFCDACEHHANHI